ncbi:MAG: hypothetical protein WD988_01715 [Candidatus Curtissbacteria bacterium]
MPAKFGLFILWIFLTPAVIGISTFLLTRYPPTAPISRSIVAEGIETNSLEGQVLGIKVSDMRPFQVASILKGTALEPHSQYMVEIADKYGIDYKLIPAISIKESGGGNNIPQDSFNAWGFENGKTKFGSWEQAIDIVGKTLKTRYIDKGLITPEQIMPVYAPPAVLNGGGWARDINFLFSKIESF